MRLFLRIYSLPIYPPPDKTSDSSFSPSQAATMLPWLSLLPLLSLFLPLTSCTYMSPNCNGSTTDKDKLYIQGFVPATGDVYTSETIVPAATVACKEINSNSSILEDYELVIDWSDTMVCTMLYSPTVEVKKVLQKLIVGNVCFLLLMYVLVCLLVL